MMRLTTHCQAIEQGVHRVYWRTGLVNAGVLDVHLDFETDDPSLAAEIVAIRHLLFSKKVFDRAPMKGQGYKLYVSQGAIKKLVLGKSSKVHLSRFAAFLSGRMKGVEIEVRKSTKDMPSEADVTPEQIIISYDAAVSHEILETPAMGTVLITKHAIEQYDKRNSSGDTDKPFSSLVKRLSNAELKRYDLPEAVLKHKARKYGTAENVEVWRHPTSDVNFVVLRERGQRVLVTVFERAGERESNGLKAGH